MVKKNTRDAEILLDYFHTISGGIRKIGIPYNPGRIRGVFGVFTGCIRGAFGMYSGCIRDVFGVYSGCIHVIYPGVFGVHSGCIRGVFGVYSGCVYIQTIFD